MAKLSYLDVRDTLDDCVFTISPLPWEIDDWKRVTVEKVSRLRESINEEY